jgi:hypothetical protein
MALNVKDHNGADNDFEVVEGGYVTNSSEEIPFAS